jgi:hypothetical protein
MASNTTDDAFDELAQGSIDWYEEYLNPSISSIFLSGWRVMGCDVGSEQDRGMRDREGPGERFYEG